MKFQTCFAFRYKFMLELQIDVYQCWYLLSKRKKIAVFCVGADSVAGH